MLPRGNFGRPSLGGFYNPENIVLRQEPLQKEEVAWTYPLGNGTAVVVPKYGPDRVVFLRDLRTIGVIPN